MNATASRPVVTAFEWVPEFARGLVRDLRVRWALEEIGAPYDTELLNARLPRPEAYLARQPFDQVPAFTDGDLEIFETGAILLYLGEKDGRLLPAGGQARWTAIAWLFRRSTASSRSSSGSPPTTCATRTSHGRPARARRRSVCAGRSLAG